ncbi:type II toxin-antitoxin system HicB family antitoxin [Companilactobacillus sp.]|jgi:predicted RNase H-like HicB family nuclease|uniref:type II toxin-antitoxin system HicB family antitoxin n=1 Tax=Companilactobacillus sp. TaxID=2767905 RepID=UPI0025BC9400|nr:hypothetical protein [Companilactobacillus sp.]MCH4009916.1 type II toxin-antitoxin system HicB family antitoxin [Companilactobacillus sp.]MCH4052408.1 type II toxin-antitoxin system HicB family antitoxin [Companilactobacillus sp.]MCH4077858.1 type II toxin-antitoxin system HicB family antitoxin [Companilactobacillus sp.]MCH4126434.1 type II toxin-antitoxin system HicB family antitoxin [Companilactobacillus sp.]MCH4132020.1 type II toxin-antitoxin system HicB family antitoxin [Companilactob
MSVDSNVKREHNLLIYPIIISKFTDDSEYFVATSPIIPGMVTQGDTMADAAYWSIDAIATMMEDEDYPKSVDPSNWELNDNQIIVYVPVDMNKWIQNNSHLVNETITIPEYINTLAIENGIDVSQIATQALIKELRLE